jgi:hypothetical protein
MFFKLFIYLKVLFENGKERDKRGLVEERLATAGS